jgi:hypothetical protein
VLKLFAVFGCGPNINGGLGRKGELDSPLRKP